MRKPPDLWLSILILSLITVELENAKKLKLRKQLKHVLAKVDKSHFAVSSKSRLNF